MTALEIVRDGMARDVEAAQAFDEAENRILQYIDDNRADFMDEGVRYAKMIDDLLRLGPPADEEDYLVKLSQMKRKKVLTWGPTGEVKLCVQPVD